MSPRADKKERVTIPEDLAAKVMVDHDRKCCVCRQGEPLEIHHIDENPANNDEENLAVLCKVCHWKTQLRGGIDRKLNAAQVRLFRKMWLEQVRFQRNATATSERPAGQSAPAIEFRNAAFIDMTNAEVRGYERAVYGDNVHHVTMPGFVADKYGSGSPSNSPQPVMEPAPVVDLLRLEDLLKAGQSLLSALTCTCKAMARWPTASSLCSLL